MALVSCSQFVCETMFGVRQRKELFGGNIVEVVQNVTLRQHQSLSRVAVLLKNNWNEWVSLKNIGFNLLEYWEVWLVKTQTETTRVYRLQALYSVARLRQWVKTGLVLRFSSECKHNNLSLWNARKSWSSGSTMYVEDGGLFWTRTFGQGVLMQWSSPASRLLNARVDPTTVRNWSSQDRESRRSFEPGSIQVIAIIQYTIKYRDIHVLLKACFMSTLTGRVERSPLVNVINQGKEFAAAKTKHNATNVRLSMFFLESHSKTNKFPTKSNVFID